MPPLDMRAFPELRNLSSDRDRAVSYARLRRALEPGRSEAIIQFWEQVGDRLDNQDDLEAMERLVTELERDISLLQAVKEAQTVDKADPQAGMQQSMVARMLRILIDLLFQYKKRLAELKEQALRYFLMVNPAIPSKVRDKMEQDKQKKKGNRKPAGQAKAKQAVDQAPKTKDPDKKSEKKDKMHAREKKEMAP